VRKPWEKQESRLAGIMNGTRNAGSGNGWVRKADVRDRQREYLAECKHTEHQSYRLTVADLKALGHHADRDGRIPVFHLEMGTERYVVLRERDWEHE